MQAGKHNLQMRRILLPTVYYLLLTVMLVPIARAQSTPPPSAAPDFQSVIARQAALVTEFDVNGLKVLVKRREGSQTVAAGLFIRGGVAKIRATNDRGGAVMFNIASRTH